MKSSSPRASSPSHFGHDDRFKTAWTRSLVLKNLAVPIGFCQSRNSDSTLIHLRLNSHLTMVTIHQILTSRLFLESAVVSHSVLRTKSANSYCAELRMLNAYGRIHPMRLQGANGKFAGLWGAYPSQLQLGGGAAPMWPQPESSLDAEVCSKFMSGMKSESQPDDLPLVFDDQTYSRIQWMRHLSSSAFGCLCWRSNPFNFILSTNFQGESFEYKTHGLMRLAEDTKLKKWEYASINWLRQFKSSSLACLQCLLNGRRQSRLLVTP